MKKHLLFSLFFALLFVFGSQMVGVAQTTIYSEDFTGQIGKGAVGTGPTIDVSGVAWTVDVSGATLSATSDWFRVENNGGAEFEARDVDGDAIWLSPSISISGYSGVEITADASEDGTMEGSDFIRFEYRVDGGAWQQFSTNGELSDDFSTATASQAGLSGSSLELRITCNNGAGSEYHQFDNILVEGVLSSSDTEVNFTSATSTVTEDGTSVQVCAGIVNESATGTTVTLNLTGGTATNGTDFFSNAGLTNAFPASQTLTFPSNSSTNQCVTVYIEDDAADEGDETVTFSLTGANGGTNAAVGSTDIHTLTIEDNDAPPVCGSETFDNSNLTGSYSNGSFVGDNGVTWTYVASRDESTYGITGNGIMLRRSSDNSEVQSSSVAGGIADFSCSLRKAFTGSGNRQVELFVNGVSQGTSIAWDNTNVQSFNVSGINIAGNVVVEIRNITGSQVIVDDIEWTCYTPAFPPVELSASASSGTEAAATVITLTATAAFAVTGDQTVDLTVTGTGITAGDYTLGATSITILDGQTTGTTTFTVVDDAVTEATETATVTIDNPSAGVTIGATDAVDIDIIDNDAPIITTSVGSLSGFTAVVGSPSTEQTFTVSGDNLSGNLSIASLTGFEYSLDNTTYTSTLTIPVSGGNVTGEPRTVYVRLTGASVGSFSGNATISGGSASSVNVALDGTVTPAPISPCTELFISEYVEGSSNNKYIEIYNPTSSAIDLAAGNYSLRLYSNGASAPSTDASLSGTIPGYGTVVYRNSSATIYGGATTVNSAVGFNGDDAVALAKNGTNIDIFGVIGEDPGAQWNVGGNETADQTLVRNADIEAGVNTNPGTFAALGTDWTEYAQNDVSNLGSHTCDCFTPNPEASFGINVATGTEAGTTQIILTVSTDATVTGAQTVDITLTGTADENDFTGADFSSPITVTIPDGDDEVTLTFNVNDDSDVEGGETATFTIGNPSSGVNIGSPSSQDLSITDDDNLTSNESIIVEQSGETPSISSLVNGSIVNSSQGVQVWHFRLYDGDGINPDADTKPTIYTGWVIRQSAGNTVPDWSEVIEDREFFVGASATPLGSGGLTQPTNIPSPIINPSQYITVPDNGFVDIYLRLTLKTTLPAGTDGQHFGFSLVTADVDVEPDVLLSSQLGTFTETSDASLNEIGVTATLQFIDAPSTVSVGSNFSITVSAIDANGNIDSDETVAVALSQTTGSGTLSGTGTQNLVNGTYTFTGLSHDTEETIQVTASASGYSNLNATINVVDEPYQLFDDFNRPNNNTVGIPSSESSATYTETGTGNGSRSRIQDNQLLLANCNNGETSGGSNGMEQVMFNVQNRHETTYDDAGGTLAWVFNMNQNRSNPSGFGSNTYAAGVILGSTQSDVENASASGYAVIIGNSGDPDPVKLVRFANGLSSNANVTDVAVSTENNDESHFSIRVEYNPCNGEWSFYVRDDGGSFADPNTGSLGSATTATDQTHTDEDLQFFGYIWQHGTSCTETATFDNVNIPNAASATTTAKVWNGSQSADWNNADNWGPCPGVPTITDDVEIANVATQPIISGATPVGVCNNLTVDAGATLTINSGRQLSADGNVTNNGTVTVENGGNFIQTQNGTAAHTGSGNFVVRRQGNGSGGFNGWSTPVVGGSLPGSNGYSYNSALGTNSNADDNNPDPDPGWQSAGGTMTAGRGYFSTDGGAATFTGRANNGNYSPSVTSSGQPLSSTTAPTFFNLIGNPYPSSINADQFILDNSSRIDGALYFWSDENAGSAAYSSDDYATYSMSGAVVPLTGGGSSGVPNGSIPSCQGFFVNCDASGTINFNNGQRGGNNSQFFSVLAPTHQRMWLSINNSSLERFNQTLVAFDDDATDQKDWGVDAYKLRGNQAISIGAQQDGETYVIATYASVPQSGKVVPLMTYVETAGTYTFVADSMEGLQDHNVYLQDLNDGMLYPLEQGDAYSFSMTSDDEFGRFQLWFSPNLVTGIDEGELMGSIYHSADRGIIVRSTEAINTSGSLQVLDMSGRIVFNDHLVLSNGVGSAQISGLARGVYAVQFNTADGEFSVSRKIVLGQ